ncbi:hypothetical protein [Paraherbaspirillum soli]|uniref:Uncharacterized protein n=1 Tax=Paraherbaspirillum soli TaxID=631222 RepID=A0ABW0MEJ3_9BURK
MDDSLTKDEYDALGQISKAPRHGRVSACVARNAKRLAGLKFVTRERDGSLVITDKGKQTLFVKSCIDGLRAVADDPLAKLAVEVATFLGKKGHIKPSEAGGGFDITQKGRECLADIDSTTR